MKLSKIPKHLWVGVLLLCVLVWLALNRPTVTGDAPGGPPSSGRPENVQVVHRDSPEEGAWIKVVSEANGKPIQGATVEWGQETTLTGPGGRARVKSTGRGHVRIRAPGHILSMGAITIDRGEYEISMMPSGTLEVTFVDETGRSVAGVEVVIQQGMPERRGVLDPSDGVRPAAFFMDLEQVQKQQVSDSDGKVTWTDLYPGSGFSWKILSDHVPYRGKDRTLSGEKITITPQGMQFGGSSRDEEDVVIRSGQITRKRVELVAAPCIVSGTLLGPANGNVSMARISGCESRIACSEEGFHQNRGPAPLRWPPFPGEYQPR